MSRHLFSTSTTDLVYKVILFLFNVDGLPTDEQNSMLYYFLLITSRYQSSQNDFQKLMADEPDTVETIAADLKKIEDDDIFFHFLLQTLALVSAAGLSEKETEAVRDILNGVDLDGRKRRIIEDLFIEENLRNSDILSIGNNSDINDIVKGSEDVRAFVVYHESKYYFLSKASEGVLKINHNGFFDQFVFMMKEGDKLSIGTDIISYSDIKLRSEFKRYDMHAYFSIVQKTEHGRTRFSLVPGDIEEAQGSVLIKGCHIIVMNQPSSTKVSIGEYKIGQDIYTGGIDDKISIGDSFMFDLSTELQSIALTNTIALQIIDNNRIIVGNESDCDIILPLTNENDTTKLILERVDDENWFIDASLTPKPIYVDNRLIEQEGMRIKSGCIIGIDKDYIIFDPQRENVRLVKNQIQSIRLDKLSYRHPNGTYGLENISIESFSKDFCCIMGPSGSGKTTLVKTIAGYHRPENDDMLLYNNLPLMQNYKSFKRYIGYVGQDDVLFENLSVYENMLYYARIKSPDMSEEELEQRIDALLIDLGIYGKKHTVTGSPEKRLLSGGERKRLSMALELITDCEVLILDEPTSGLSSFEATKILDILSYIARQGKIVYVVIHQPNMEMFLRFSHMLLLDEGGHLAYYGRTKSALRYFSKYTMLTNKTVNTPDDILGILEAVKRSPSGEIIYESDAQNNKYPVRVKQPEEWNEEFENRKKDFSVSAFEDFKAEKIIPREVKFDIPKQTKRTFALFARNLANKFNDSSAILLSFIIPAALAVFLSGVLRYNEGGGAYTYNDNIHIPKYLFLVSIIFIFLAISNSISEVLKDRLFIYKEKTLGYSAVTYLFGKTITLLIISLYQVFIFMLISFWMLKIPIVIIHEGELFFRLFWRFYSISIISSLATISLGLFISSFLRSEKAAFLAVPLLIIPQIIFGGLFLHFNELRMLNVVNPQRPVPIVCNLAYSRWMYESYLNVMRFEVPTKQRRFNTKSFHDKYSSYKNDELLDLFRTYNLSRAKDDELKERLDEIEKERIYEFEKAIDQTRKGDLSLEEYIDLELNGSINYFPYYRKIMYPFVLKTYTYNNIVMLVFFLVFFFGSAVKIEYDKGSFSKARSSGARKKGDDDEGDDKQHYDPERGEDLLDELDEIDI